MTAEEVGARLAEAIGADVSVSAGGSFARPCATVPVASWVDTVRTARDALDLQYFDWLSGVDEGDEGFAVVVHLWSLTERFGVLLRTVVPRETPTVPTLTGVFPGASWPERETAEMFGVEFTGHPNPGKLLLPDEFEGHPLRKEFVLAARVAKAWPGAKEPGESDTGAPSRRRARPPGVPDPNEWGPDKGKLPPEPAGRRERPARAARRPREEKPDGGSE
ncbi:NADH-quinone oxidoreductase subunit C [Cryptosporangium sp. NPDC048952]|uniref:NADH-quinone oxidoreductase subunit C n=1 Tax=Cryptosporangium sp. NPDC048952 TaxID=3363961 RepID=UPI003717EB93